MTELGAIKLAASVENLPAAAACVLKAARGQGLDARLGDIELVVEECFTNICKYSGSADIALTCLADEKAFVLQIRDSGSAFDPTAHPDPDVKAPIEQRPEGGLGVYLTKKLSDGLEYRREGGQNVLRVSFRR